MQAIADALIELVVYLSIVRQDESGASLDSDRDDDDIEALEGIVAVLGSATPAEREALHAAILRGVEGENSRQPEPSQVRLACYQDILETLDLPPLYDETDAA